MTTLEERSREAHGIASEKAKGSTRWNNDYRAALNEIGFDLIQIDGKTQVGANGPLWAPYPATSGDPYPYPCVIAPIGWEPE